MRALRSTLLMFALTLPGANAQTPAGPQTPVAPSAPAAAPAPPAPADELAGLWKAKRWFGPFARGPLVLRKMGTDYFADMAGRTVPVREERGALSFELPNGQGSFRGRLQAGGAIVGHWFPPNAVIQLSCYASPVRLKPDGPGRWSGVVVPFEDVFTLYLQASKRPDGSLGAFVRNPERDYGAWLA